MKIKIGQKVNLEKTALLEMTINGRKDLLYGILHSVEDFNIKKN